MDRSKNCIKMTEGTSSLPSVLQFQAFDFMTSPQSCTSWEAKKNMYIGILIMSLWNEQRHSMAPQHNPHQGGRYRGRWGVDNRRGMINISGYHPIKNWLFLYSDQLLFLHLTKGENLDFLKFLTSSLILMSPHALLLLCKSWGSEAFVVDFAMHRSGSNLSTFLLGIVDIYYSVVACMGIALIQPP